jgi:hypothetical protein
MKDLLFWSGMVAGVLAVIVILVAGIGAALPVKHKATKSVSFAVTAPRLWELALALYHRTNDGSYTVQQELAPQRLVTAIIRKDLPYGGIWTYDFRPQDHGTVLTITEDGEVYNPIFRCVARFIVGHGQSIETFFAALRADVAAESGSRRRDLQGGCQ